MKLTTTWGGSKYALTATDGKNATLMDAKAPAGGDAALTPKQLCLASITGCTGMDVIAYFHKQRQALGSLRIESDATIRKGHPAIFEQVQLDYYFEGSFPTNVAVDAVRLSQTEECGVSAMIARACPISYRVFVNGSLMSQGEARFPRG